MKIVFIAILFLVVFQAKAQNSITGLYGKCNKPYSSISCNQMLLNQDSTFEYFIYLDVGGNWLITKGKWEQIGDTIILNTIPKPYRIEYTGKSKGQEVQISVQGSDTLPLKFAIVKVCSVRKKVDSAGLVYFPRKSLDTISILYVGLYDYPIPLDFSKVQNCKTIKITLYWDYRGGVFFENEKWLLKNDNLFFIQDETGNYDKDAFYEKTHLSDLKYKSK